MNETTERSIAHAQFTIERDLPVSPERAFAAFATLEEKQKWFGGHSDDWDVGEHTLDFRVGGSEVQEGTFRGEMTSRFVCTYTDIVEAERIVYTYDMWLNGNHISTSLATYEFEPAEGGTRMTMVESGAHLDGYDTGSQREEGTIGIIDDLVEHLSS